MALLLGGNCRSHYVLVYPDILRAVQRLLSSFFDLSTLRRSKPPLSALILRDRMTSSRLVPDDQSDLPASRDDVIESMRLYCVQRAQCNVIPVAPHGGA